MMAHVTTNKRAAFAALALLTIGAGFVGAQDELGIDGNPVPVFQQQMDNQQDAAFETVNTGEVITPEPLEGIPGAEQQQQPGVAGQAVGGAVPQGAVGEVGAVAGATPALDPSGFGELPSYKQGDAWGRKSGSSWTGKGEEMLKELGDTVNKAMNAAGKKADSHAAPRVKGAHKDLHKSLHKQVKDFVPKHYSPFVSAVISYTLPLIPLCLAMMIFQRLKAMLSLQKVLLVINIYNACYCGLLVVINMFTGNEPMASLQASNEADYIILQFLKCAGYAIFILLQMLHLGVLWNTKAETMKVVAAGNLVLSFCIGFHYFIKVWGPAMHGHPPTTSQVSYMLYTVMFSSMAYSTYMKDPGERAQAAELSNMLEAHGFGTDKQG